MAGGILVATDLSARTDRAVERALLVGRQLNVPVTILHVLEDGIRLSSDEEQRLRGLLQYEFGLADQKTEIRFASGSVPPTIAKLAKERGCSLIVTGVARFNQIRDFVLGTAVDYLIRQSSCPVLIVKRRARKPYERLIVATDFSSAAARALVASAEIFPDAKVLLVHAYQAAFEAFLAHDTTAPVIRDEAKREMKRLVAELPERLRSRIESMVQEGPAATIISKNVSELGDDLLVLGTWHRRRHAHFMGSDDAWTMPNTEPYDILVVGKTSSCEERTRSNDSAIGKPAR